VADDIVSVLVANLKAPRVLARMPDGVTYSARDIPTDAPVWSDELSYQGRPVYQFIAGPEGAGVRVLVPDCDWTAEIAGIRDRDATAEHAKTLCRRR
jgi:hypothetical protein